MNTSLQSAPLLRTSAVALGASACLIGPLATTAEATVGFFRATVNGAEVVDELLLSGPGQTGGESLSGQFQAEGVEMTVYYAIDPNPEGLAVMSGNIIFLNTTAEPVELTGELLMPICPQVLFLPPALLPKIGGVASVRINADADGGSITCHGGHAKLNVVLGTDGAAVFPAFNCPFELALTGAGTAVTSVTFGLPGASMPVAAPFEHMGHGVALTLTPGDKATFALFYLLNGISEPLVSSNCPADINADGAVDAADLALILARFGTLAECGLAEDIDRNGLVDGADLAQVLAQWGPCLPSGG